MQPVHSRLALSALICGAVLLATTACTDREAQRQAQAAAEAQAREQAATKLQGEYDAAVASNNWELARIHGTALLAQYPGTEAAAAVEPALADVTARADAVREQRRLSALWNYARVAAGKGEQRTAAIFSKEPLDTGGSAPATVQLVIRDHPEWKRSAYLVLGIGVLLLGMPLAALFVRERPAAAAGQRTVKAVLRHHGVTPQCGKCLCYIRDTLAEHGEGAERRVPAA